MQKIVPNLWFDSEAHDAALFYTSLFPNSTLDNVSYYSEVGFEHHQRPSGSVMTVEYTLDGYKFCAINGGPIFKMNPSISFLVYLNEESEVDRLFGTLSQNGHVIMELGEHPFSKRSGWVSDQWGCSWKLIYSEKRLSHHIVPSLQFTGEQFGNAHAAIVYYTSIFPASSIEEMKNYKNEPVSLGCDTIAFSRWHLGTQYFAATDAEGDHDFSFNEAISLSIACRDQAEIDWYWNHLSYFRESEACGWLKDKFGVSWQVVPYNLGEILSSHGEEKAKLALAKMFEMKKLDIGQLLSV